MTDNNLQTIHPGSKPGTIQIGDVKIPCFVLEDGTRILSEHGVTSAMKSRSGASKRKKKIEQEEGRAHLPVFMASNNLNPYISDALRVGLTNPIKYHIGERISQGYPAELLPKICEVWLSARDEGSLRKDQLRKCKQAEILMRGLAHVGIIALVDEATDFQEIRDKLALQKILDKYLLKEFAKWAKRFPDEFYILMFKLKGWDWKGMKINRPSVVGKYTNDLVYERLAPGLLKKLKHLNPPDEQGRRRSKHQQWLTEEIGHPALQRHLAMLIGFERASANWGMFYRMVQRALPKVNEQIPLALEE